MRIIILAGLLVSCGRETVIEENLNPCEYIVSGLCVQLEEGQTFKPDLLTIPMEHIEAITNELWPGLELQRLMEYTDSDLFYITDWQYNEVGYNIWMEDFKEHTIEVQYINQCYGKYWQPISEIQHTIARYHLDASYTDNLNHNIPRFFGTDESSVEAQMERFIAGLCWYNWFLGNDY